MILRTLAVVFVICTALFAQKSVAPAGYYPADYYGDMFTGVVTNTQGDELTLTYQNGKRAQTFVGRFASICHLPVKGGKTEAMTAENFPVGTKMSAMFRSRTKNAGGRKVKENEIIAVTFESIAGKELKKNNDVVWVCLPAGTSLQFRPFQ